MTTYLNRSWQAAGFALMLLVLSLAACQSNKPPGPTPIPTITRTATASPVPTGSSVPTPTLRPLIEATSVPPTGVPVVDASTPSETPGPHCLIAKKGDTVFGLLYQGGYVTYPDALMQKFRELNNMPPGSNTVTVGEKYCIPLATPTPAPPGLGATQTKQCQEVGCGVKVASVATYVVVKDDNIIVLQLKLGVTLRELCELNHPNPLNCGGCDIDKPIGQQGCRVNLRVGDVIRYPGPTPTPTVTPTLTGSETATSTPVYSGPRIVEPVNGAALSGVVLLRWLPVGILQPDEQYLVLLSDATIQPSHTWEFDTQATSIRLPADIQPTDGQPHTFNWQLMVTRKAPDGAYMVVGQKSVIYSFTLQPQ